MATPALIKTHLNKFWDDEYKKLDYQTEQFNDPISQSKWIEQGYPGPYVGAMCDMRSPQPSWNDSIVAQFVSRGWKDVGTSYYRMDTGVILPTHQDLYLKYVGLFGLHGQQHNIYRAIIYLEDWASGHYAEYQGEPFIKWCAGDCVIWQYDVPHMAANIGPTPRYTLQVTGHI